MPREIITVPPLPDGTESGISIDITKKLRKPYNYTEPEIPLRDITLDSIDIVADEIINKNLTRHERKVNDYSNNGIIDIKTLAKVIHHNHSSEVHNSIVDNSSPISYVNLYYGDNKVRLESNGSIMAIVLYCRNIPKTIAPPSGWKYKRSGNKIVLYTEGDSLLNGDITLFTYITSLRVLKAEVIGAEEILYFANINTEAVDYYELLKGNWETMDSVYWENYKGVY
jgi:hypothetical protein